MDAPPSSSERTRELAALRSRAYGPDADIHLDADALARLVELEEVARTDAAASVSAVPLAAAPTAEHASRVEPASAPAGVTEPAAHGAAAGAPTVITVPTGPGDPAERAADRTERDPRRPRWWRRVPTWALIGVTAIVGIGIGLAAPAMIAPQPAAVLRSIPLDGAEFDTEPYGMYAESTARYERFHNLEVWTAERPDGAVCIFVTGIGDEWNTAGCAPELLDPMADLNVYPMMPEVEGLELAEGSVVRFILRDGVVEVWIAPFRQEA